LFIDHFAIGRAAALGDPGSRTRPHDRFHCGHETARGAVAGHAVVTMLVNIGLAVRHHDDFIRRKIVPEQGPQAFRAPLRHRLRLLAAGTIDFAQQPLQVPHQGLQSGAAPAGAIQIIQVMVPLRSPLTGLRLTTLLYLPPLPFRTLIRSPADRPLCRQAATDISSLLE
jgi:hypothetical protein